MPPAIGFRALSFALAMLVASLSSAYGQGRALNKDDRPSKSAQESRANFHARLAHEIKRLQVHLGARGYEVAVGATQLFTINDCRYTVETIGNCMGPNPAAPYIMPTVPLWPDEFVDGSMRKLLGPLPRQTWATFRFDRREALLVVGDLPPTGKYFGIQTYVFSREAALNVNDPVYQASLADPAMHAVLFATAPNPSRIMVFSSIGDSINNSTIERRSGAAFGEQRSFVISTDQGMAREMTEALVNTRISTPEQVFVEPVSTEVARIGLHAGADEFMTIIRYARPQDENAANRWRKDPPLFVLRVRDRNAVGTEPWPRPEYDPKAGSSEMALESSLDMLVAAVKEQWGQPSATAGQFRSLQASVDLIGQHCLVRPMSCLGDTQDADYQASPTVNLDDGKVIAVAGTLGTATGNASYVGLSVNWMKILKGVINVSDDELLGSASRFSGTVANTGKLYLHYYARDCSGISNCQQVTEDMVPKGEAMKIIQRNYVVPGTARGADPKYVLNPFAIILDGTARPTSN